MIFNNKNNVFEEIRLWQEKNKFPILIWGTGSVAVGVYKNLLKENIKVEGFFYDTDLAVIDPRIKSENATVISLKEVLEKYSKVAVIIGHSRYEIVSKIEKIDAVVKIWALTGIIRVGIKLTQQFIEDNLSGYEYTYQKLEDNKSKENMVSYLNAHLTNDSSFIINKFETPMTFFDNDIFSYSDNEIYCDCGAYDGKSIKNFLKCTNNKYNLIYAIEVMNDMCEKLHEDFIDSRINIVNVGLSDHTGIDYFSFDSQSTCLSKTGVPVEVKALDDIVESEPVSLIKIAIGEEIDKILLGAKQVIRTNLPKIVIMAGVDKNALIKYIPLIESIAGKDKYKYYLRYTNATTDCLCLFAKV